MKPRISRSRRTGLWWCDTADQATPFKTWTEAFTFLAERYRCGLVRKPRT